MYLMSCNDSYLSTPLRVIGEKCSKIKEGVEDCSSMQKSISFIMFEWPSKALSILISQYIFDSQTGFNILITTGLSVFVSNPSWTSLYFPLPKGPDISYYSVGLFILPELHIDLFILRVF